MSRLRRAGQHTPTTTSQKYPPPPPPRRNLQARLATRAPRSPQAAQLMMRLWGSLIALCQRSYPWWRPKSSIMAILPTHHSRFQPIPVHRSGLRLREKYVLLLIFIAFLLLCFGAFFFVPDLRDRTYLENAYKKFVGAGGDILPIRPPKTPIVKHVEGKYLIFLST